MTAGYYDLTIEKGTDWEPQFTIRDERRRLIDLTDWSANMHIRASQASASTILAFTDTDGTITLGGVLGTVTLHATAAQTSAVTALTGVYDLELINAQDKTARYLEGTVTFSPEVTR